MPIVSVIVPIYNVEQYLRQCVDSILRQSLRQMEIILVDDGSPDSCGAICDEYAEKDPRVRVIHKPNGGVVSAWKAGISAALADYVGFVDADDWIDGKYFEELYDAAVRMDADVVEGQFVRQPASGEIRQGNLHTRQTNLTGMEAVATLLSSQVVQTGPTVANNRWTKLYRRSLLLDNMDLFDERIKNGDDVVMNTAVLADARQVVLLPSRAKYRYRITAGSLYQTYQAEPGSEDQLRNIQYYYQALLRIAQEKPAIRHVVEIHLGADTYSHIYGDCTRAGESLRTRTALIRRRMSIVPPEVLDVYADARGGMFIHVFCRMLRMGLTVPCAWTIRLHNVLQGGAGQPPRSGQDAQAQTAGDAAYAATPVDAQPDRHGTSPLFSVIVPVYNAEHWLSQCVDSILNQSCDDWELLLVDDGSRDSCPVLCDTYAAQDKRIIAIHQSNSGPTAARRTGLHRARGEYALFVDADDWVVPHWLQTVRELIESYNWPDVVLYDYARDNGQTEKFLLAAEGYYDKARLEEEIYPWMLCDMRRRPFGSQLFPGMLWSKAVKRQLLAAHFITDDRVTVFEDAAMSYDCVYNARSMYVTHERLYMYRRVPQSNLLHYRADFFQQLELAQNYMLATLGGKTAALDRQISGFFAQKLTVGVLWELQGVGGRTIDAARAMAKAPGRAALVRKISPAGLPSDIWLYVVLFKLRLFWPAVLFTKWKSPPRAE